MKEIQVKIGIVVAALSIFLFSYQSQRGEGSEPNAAKQVQQSSQETEPEVIMVSVTSDGNVEQIELESYLVGVVAGEMPASFELEALKAQVVASRTFVLKRGLEVDNTTSTQVHLTDAQMQSNWGDEYASKKQKIEQAIAETKGEVMKYNGDYISALFFSSTNGYTENCDDYFNGEAVPYLRTVESPWDAKVNTNNVRTKTFTKEELQNAFGYSDIALSIISHKDSGRVETVQINEDTYTGREVREKLGLASSDFVIDFDGEQYTFTTTGSGHGVGMSQYGAQGMALEGYHYQDILKHYYTNVEIVKN